MPVRRFVPSFLLALAMVVTGSPVFAQLLGSLDSPLAPLEPVLSKLDPLVQSRLSNSGHSRVIVRASSSAALPQLNLLIQANGGTLKRQLPILEAVAAEVPNSSFAILTNSSLVRRIALDRLVHGASGRTGGTVGSTLARQEFGYDGTGVGVAVIDSGIDAGHDDLTAPELPGGRRVVQFVDFVNGAGQPYDDYGHGTHVAGIVAGNGYDSNGGRAGIAPGAHLVVLKVLDATGRGHISNVIAALDYAIQQRGALQIRVINLSIGSGVFESCETDLLTLAARHAVDAGIVVVASAGNAGRDPWGRTQYGGITAPGNAPWVLTVGASSHMGTIDRADDTIAGFSSRGPTAIDRRAKPDLVAPGVGIESLSAPGSVLFASKSNYLLNGTVPTSYLPYLSLSGTSQAAPVIAGTVALMLQANPALTPNAVKAILQFTAQVRLEYDALTQGAGFANARAAIELSRYFAAPATMAYPFGHDWSRHLIWGNQRVQDGWVTPDANGWQTTVRWGAARTPASDDVEWGVICSTFDCSSPDAWNSWETECIDYACLFVSWGSGSRNVVWGDACGGQDCPPLTPYVLTLDVANMASDGDTVVWGTTDDGDTVVWGTSEDGDTVVWGTADNGDTVVWGTTEDGDTVVWGTSGDEHVVWGTTNENPGSTEG
jgi:serine protease AprX